MQADSQQDASWAPYYRVCLKSGRAVEAVEIAIASLSASPWLTTDEIRRRAGNAVSLDQVVDILSALAAVGVGALHDSRRWRCDDVAFRASTHLRSRVRSSVQWTDAALSQREPSLLISTPLHATQPEFKREFADLRTTLRALIADSQRELILASPFWDLDVAADLAALLAKRLDAGVRIRVIARLPQPGSPSDRAIALISRLGVEGRRCDVRIVDKASVRDRFGRETFHFKMIGADASAVYVGSANFDTAGLASRWELGVLLRGDAARRVFDLVDALGDVAPAYKVQ